MLLIIQAAIGWSPEKGPGRKWNCWLWGSISFSHFQPCCSSWYTHAFAYTCSLFLIGCDDRPHPALPLVYSFNGSVQPQAEIDFGYATTVLGKEGSVDFLDSSPWPFSVIDAFININEIPVRWKRVEHGWNLRIKGVVCKPVWALLVTSFSVKMESTVV